MFTFEIIIYPHNIMLGNYPSTALTIISSLKFSCIPLNLLSYNPKNVHFSGLWAGQHNKGEIEVPISMLQ